MNHDHDLDLIAALVEGRSTDPAHARELVSSCRVCAAAYADHRAVLSAVAADPVPVLDDLERHRLRAAVWAETQEVDSPVASRPPRSDTTPWWYRIAPVAAAMVVVVGVGLTLSNGLGGDGAETGVTAARDIASDELAGSADRDEFADSAADDDGAGEDATALQGPETATTAPTEEASTGAADTTMAAADGGAVVDPVVISSDELEAAIDQFATRAEMVEQYDPGSDLTAVDRCVTADEELEDGRVDRVMRSEPATLDDIEMWLVAFGQESVVDSVVIYRAADCQVMFRRDG